MRDLILPPRVVFEFTDGRGRSKRLRRKANAVQELRCMVLATATVFARHGLAPTYERVVVQWTDEWVIDPERPRQQFCGLAWYADGRMQVTLRSDHERTLATVIHEWIHLCGYRSETDEHEVEWTVSTLTAKFKPEVAALAATLLQNYYQGAAFIAHTRPGMAYHRGAATGGETYNDEQWRPVGVVWDTKHRRGGKRCT